MPRDLLSGLDGPETLPERPDARRDGPPPAEKLRLRSAALAALARAFGHDHVLSYPRRNPEGEYREPPPPGESWLRGYSETLGFTQASRFLRALNRLDEDDRAAIRDEMTRARADG